MQEQKIVGRYYKLPPRKRIDYIMSNYDRFQGMVNNYENDLKVWTLRSIAKARQDATAGLGVRVQSGSSPSSPQAKVAEDRDCIDAAFKNGALDASLRGIEDYDDINRGLKELELMRDEYAWFMRRFYNIHPENRDVFRRYISKQTRTEELASELSITSASLNKKIYLIRRVLVSDAEKVLGVYDDDSIIYYLSGGGHNGL